MTPPSSSPMYSPIEDQTSGVSTPGSTSAVLVVDQTWRSSQDLASAAPVRQCGLPSVVIGRDCRMKRLGPASAHSMSCGAPKTFSTLSARRASFCATASEIDGLSARAGETGRSTGEPVGEKAVSTDFVEIERSTIRRLPRSITKRSGVTLPETSASPRPQQASTMMRSGLPETGSAVKTTPAASAATSCCTMTAMAAPSCSNPFWVR